MKYVFFYIVGMLFITQTTTLLTSETTTRGSRLAELQEKMDNLTRQQNKETYKLLNPNKTDGKLIELQRKMDELKRQHNKQTYELLTREQDKKDAERVL